MSPEAVDQRLRDLSQLFRLGMSIQEAKYLGTLEDLQRGHQRIVIQQIPNTE